MARARKPSRDAETPELLGHETPESISPPDADVQTKRRYVFATPEHDAREGIPGTVVTTWVRCGKAGCRCAAGKPHGPYHYHRWREDVYEEAGGGLRWAGRRHRRRYVPRHDAPRVLALCDRHRTQRLSRSALRQLLRDFSRLSDELAGWLGGVTP